MAIHQTATHPTVLEERQPRRSSSRWWTFAWRGLCALLIVLAITQAAAWKFAGIVPVVVTSGSMSPGMPTGSLAFVREVPDSSIRVGDVITFDPPGPRGRVTHRVIERIKRGPRWYFRTKGDANATVDDWTTAATRAAPPTSTAAGHARWQYQRGVSYSSGAAAKRIWSLPLAGHVLALTSRPALRESLVFVLLGLIGVQFVERVWRHETAPDTAPTPDSGNANVGETTDRAA